MVHLKDIILMDQMSLLTQAKMLILSPEHLHEYNISSNAISKRLKMAALPNYQASGMHFTQLSCHQNCQMAGEEQDNHVFLKFYPTVYV